VISPIQGLLHNTQHSQEANIHVPGGIRNSNPRKRAAADPRLRPRGHWDRREKEYRTQLRNEELHELHSPDEVSVVIISRKMRQDRHVAGMDEKKKRIDVLV
jgi:hypothetical protein